MAHSKRRDLIADGQNLLRDTVLGTGFSVGVSTLLNNAGYDIDLGIAAITGATITLGYHLFVKDRKPSYSRVTVYQSGAAWVGDSPADDPDVNSFWLKWKDRPQLAREFVFRGYGLNMPIPESVLDRFVKTAWRRQSNALYDSRVNMLYTGSGYRQLTANQVFTRDHYTKVMRPRFTKEEYQACLYILVITRTIGQRKGGQSGRLMYPYEKTMHLAKDWWIRRMMAQSPTPKGHFALRVPFLTH